MFSTSLFRTQPWKHDASRLSCAILLVCLFLATALPGNALADRVRILDDPTEAAQARIDLIQQARHSVNAQYFIVGDDSLALAGLALARDAAWRGCTVRILVDDSYNWIPDSVLGYLLSQGVQIRVYHPFRWSRPLWITRRMHDKGLTVDGSRMILGGRNVTRSYFGIGTANLVDRDAYIEGMAARESDAYFLSLWNSDQVAPVQPRHADLLRYEEGRKAIDIARKGITTGNRWKLNTGKNWGKLLKDVGKVEFLHDTVGKKDIEPGIAERLRDLIQTARRSVLIETPYCIPTRGFFREAAACRARGVQSFQIVTNSVVSNDLMLSQVGYEASKGKILRSEISLWEFKGPETLHAKSAVIDDRYVIIGSFNLDPRSEHLNTETAVVFKNRALARQLTRSIDGHKKNAWQIGPDGNPVSDGENYASGFSLRKRVLLTFWRIPLFLIRDQL